MRLAKLLAAALSLVSLAGAAHAEIYRWTDAEGRLHFTERLERVPEEHRDAAVQSALRSRSREPAVSFEPESSLADPPAAARYVSRPGGEVVVPFRREGTLMRVEAVLNDTVTAPFLVDTGASGVSLPSEVAAQLGLRIRPDTPHVEVITANGAVSRALVRLDSVELAGARVEGLHATVNPSMDIGLLGGAFFNNFVYRVDAGASVISLVPSDTVRGGLREDEWRDRFRRLVDLLARLNAHLESDEVRRKGEIERLVAKRKELEAALEALQDEANRLDVPYAWRQ